jgi:hypothetical protein
MTNVTINLNTDVENFIRFVYRTPKGDIKITTVHSVGKVIFSQLQRNVEPVKQAYENPVTFILPCTNFTVKNGFYSITQEGALQIELFVKAYEEMYFTFVILRLKKMGYTTQRAIDAYLLMLDSNHNTDTFVKRDYRNRKKMLERFKTFWRKTAKELNEAIDFELI